MSSDWPVSQEPLPVHPPVTAVRLAPILQGAWPMASPTVFVVAFEHAHRAFKCVRVEGSASADTPSAAAQWIVTMDGRAVWSFDAQEGETRESLQRAVEQWWSMNAAAR